MFRLRWGEKHDRSCVRRNEAQELTSEKYTKATKVDTFHAQPLPVRSQHSVINPEAQTRRAPSPQHFLNPRATKRDMARQKQGESLILTYSCSIHCPAGGVIPPGRYGSTVGLFIRRPGGFAFAGPSRRAQAGGQAEPCGGAELPDFRAERPAPVHGGLWARQCRSARPSPPASSRTRHGRASSLMGLFGHTNRANLSRRS